MFNQQLFLIKLISLETKLRTVINNSYAPLKNQITIMFVNVTVFIIIYWDEHFKNYWKILKAPNFLQK